MLKCPWATESHITLMHQLECDCVHECSDIVERCYVNISLVTICIYGPMSPLVDSVFA